MNAYDKAVKMIYTQGQDIVLPTYDNQDARYVVLGYKPDGTLFDSFDAGFHACWSSMWDHHWYSNDKDPGSWWEIERNGDRVATTYEARVIP